MSRGFYRLAPFIQDYIYSNKWEELREVQLVACDVIFDTDDNLLLSSGTASGKTEAAFLPVLTLISENPPKSVGVLYLSPLKALINDQFFRLEELLAEGEINVTKWHGDAPQSAKKRLLKNPSGIIQTTPESLEAMLMRNKTAAIRLFSDLRFIIIDEIHYFMNNDRGIQLMSLIERLSRLIGKDPRRIGLSATLGDFTTAMEWFGMGTSRRCVAPKLAEQGRSIRLSVQYFPVKKGIEDEQARQLWKSYYDYLYTVTLGKRVILFSNSKGEVETNIASLRERARKNGHEDSYFVHHANISASLREFTEQTMKVGEMPVCTGATVTLELGIDLGNLERIVQTGCPLTVSSFVQRLGRTGRRGNPSEMWFAFKKDIAAVNVEFYKDINWDFVMCIAIIQLYLEERWIEPAVHSRYPYGLLYHQTMSVLCGGGMSAAKLAETLLTLDVFKNVSQDDFKLLLLFMLEKKQIEVVDGSVLIGERGEFETGSFEFFAVFETQETYTVRNKGQEIGSVQSPFPVGTQFSLAGYAWEVTDLDDKDKTIYVKHISGISSNAWIDTGNEFTHTRVLKKMREILDGDKEYPYLGESAKARLEEIRKSARKAEITRRRAIRLSRGTLAVFPWLGTKAMSALYYSLLGKGLNCALYYYGYIPICIAINGEIDTHELEIMLDEIITGDFDSHSLPVPRDVALSGKFNRFVPKELLRKQFIEDGLDVLDMKKNL